MPSTVLQFPPTDSGLLLWSQNFLNLITAAPTTYGLTAADATAYEAVHNAYMTALEACDPAVRNKTAVATKNAARATLKTSATLLANTIYGTSTVTDPQKVQLGIPPRATPAPIPPPSSAPLLEVVSVSAWTAKIRLKPAGSESGRGKPAGVSGASVFSYVGATPPPSISDWKFEGNLGKTTTLVQFSDDLSAGTKVWFSAFWFNGRKQSGPACAPVSTNLPGGSVQVQVAKAA